MPSYEALSRDVRHPHRGLTSCSMCTSTHNSAYLTEVTPLFHAVGGQQWHRIKNSVLLPEPANLAVYVEDREERTQQAEDATSDFAEARAEIDRIVADWYELPDVLRPIIDQELPFSRIATTGRDSPRTERPAKMSLKSLPNST